MSARGVAIAFALMVATTAAQAPPKALPQTPARDLSRLPNAGSGSITGAVVTDDDARAPLRRVTVTLSRSGPEDIRTASSDDQGRYGFSALPAGTFTLSFRKGAYISMDYGAPRPGVPGGRSIVLADGQAFAARPTAMLRGAVIAGRVTDSAGRPVAGAPVSAAHVVMLGGVRANSRVATSKTSLANEHGEYRIFGLLPGDHLVWTNTQQFRSLPATPSAAEIRWAAQPSGAPPPAAQATAYANTFFAGTADAASATVIALGRGEEKLGVDITVQTVPLARVSGRVTGPDGGPAANVRLQRAPKRLTPFGATITSSATSAVDGTFSFPDNPPGDYVIQARLAPQATPPVVGVESRTMPPAVPAPPLVGLAEVTVAGRDVDGVVVSLQLGATVSGRIVFQRSGQGGPQARDLGIALQNLSLLPVGMSPVPGTLGDADGGFHMEGVGPGSYRLAVTIPPAFNQQWIVKSAIQSGRDLMDGAIEIASGTSPADVVVTVSDAVTQVSGTIVDAAGQPAPELNVFVLATESGYWTPNSRRVKTVRASESGTYTITGLPAGEYYLCALKEVDLQLMYEPEYLQQLVPVSIKITLGDGERKPQNLLVGR